MLVFKDGVFQRHILYEFAYLTGLCLFIVGTITLFPVVSF